MAYDGYGYNDHCYSGHDEHGGGQVEPISSTRHSYDRYGGGGGYGPDPPPQYIDPTPQGQHYHRPSGGGGSARGPRGPAYEQQAPGYSYPPPPPGPSSKLLAIFAVVAIVAAVVPAGAAVAIIVVGDGGGGGGDNGGSGGWDDYYYGEDTYVGVSLLRFDGELYTNAAETEATLTLTHRGGPEISWSDYKVTLNGTSVAPSYFTISVGESTDFTYTFTGYNDLRVYEKYIVRIINIETDSIDWEDELTNRQDSY